MACNHNDRSGWAPAGNGNGELHVDDLGIHLLQQNCPVCHSTLATLLPGHVEEAEDAVFQEQT